MKKLIYFMSAVLVLILVLGGLSWKLSTEARGSSDKKSLTIFNWGEYIDPDLISKFEAKSGYKVNYVTFDSNEAMYAKVKQGGTAYDLVVPSEYMVQKMADEGLLDQLDHSKIKGLDNIDKNLLNPVFDRGNRYSIPYFWGTLGIVYNDKFIKNPPTSWEELWKPDYKNSILLTDDTRDVMGMGLMTTGSSVNSSNPKEISKAYDKLSQLTPNVKAILGDEIMNYMVNNETPLAVCYSGQASEMIDANEHLHYVVPKTTNVWYDNLAIPKTAKNIDGAYAFINFMLEAKNAAQNADYVGYSTPNKKAEALLDDDVKNDKAFYPDEATIKRDEAYTNLSQELTERYNDLYLQFKMHR
ncbi:ABC transporter substrate-binding protein [Lactococcus termiticola]|uniref:Spermidine/putrescine ABC transporter substrate-binding protein n=1 Tax=Lactococcus termiticola TaxID=2169526 RepID=A0A2R5HGL5_9LACT|nr:ABC transporter substrate-binding protein [Lactococcus termiticola]GBG97203.1 spermidine/putrescine ABC transporter substrate-binding protein [Lactococcus termiticola]